ncbi:MAG: aminotransferase class IV [Longimicrobiales bacterium]
MSPSRAMQVYLNGSWVEEADAAIPIDDRGFLHADAIYETARFHAGTFFRLRAHLDRLAGSARTLRMPIPPRDELERIAHVLADAHRPDDATLRITITRAGAGSDAKPGTVLVTLRPIAADWRERAARGWNVITAAVRRPPTSSIPAQLKSPGRPYAILARFEASDAGADDALLLDHAGDVCEGPTWNVFWRRGDRLFTPAPEVGVLEGVTRAVIHTLAPAAGLQIQEGRFPRAALDDADEIFATMSSLGIVPFRTLDGRPLTWPPPAAIDLQHRYWRRVRSEE